MPDRRPILRPVQAKPEEQAQVQAETAAGGRPLESAELARQQQKTVHGQAGRCPALNPQVDLTQARAGLSPRPA